MNKNCTFDRTLIYNCQYDCDNSSGEFDKKHFGNRLNVEDPMIKGYLESMDKTYRKFLLVRITDDWKLEADICFDFPIYGDQVEQNLLVSKGTQDNKEIRILEYMNKQTTLYIAKSTSNASETFKRDMVFE